MSYGYGSSVTAIQMVSAVSAIANDGVYIEPTFYTKVVDSDGNVVLESKQESRTIMSSATAYIVKEILTEVVRSGAGWYARISGISVGVKTGTSSDDVDRWFCGFTPYYTAATWYGYDENRETVRATNNPSGYIWDGVMEQVHKGLEGKTFASTRPNNVTSAKICKASGKIATELCEKDPRENQVYTEYFVKGTVPKETCTCHVTVDICKETGLLANEYCTDKETKIFITRPETETGNWSKAKDAEYMLTIKDTCTTHTAPPTPPEPETPEIPTEPETPTTPETPIEPETPTTPETPEIPEEKPTEPENPEQPENGEPEGDEGNDNENNTTENTVTNSGVVNENVEENN